MIVFCVSFQAEVWRLALRIHILDLVIAYFSITLNMVDGKALHEGGDNVDSYETKVVKEKLFVNSIPNNLGKRVTQSHEKYSKLKDAVKRHLNHMDS
jgi:hypothetical protein